MALALGEMEKSILGVTAVTDSVSPAGLSFLYDYRKTKSYTRRTHTSPHSRTAGHPRFRPRQDVRRHHGPLQSGLQAKPGAVSSGFRLSTYAGRGSKLDITICDIKFTGRHGFKIWFPWGAAQSSLGFHGARCGNGRQYSSGRSSGAHERLRRASLRADARADRRQSNDSQAIGGNRPIPTGARFHPARSLRQAHAAPRAPSRIQAHTGARVPNRPLIRHFSRNFARFLISQFVISKIPSVTHFDIAICDIKFRSSFRHGLKNS